MKANLAQRPKLDRLAAGSGIAAPKDGSSSVDREGGEHKAGLISGVAVITRGEALGHGMWIDATTLQQTADAINSAPKGAKSRFTHPGLSGDGVGKMLGRAKNASIEGDIVRADLHMTPTAHETPDGDLASYVMGLAEDDPEAFGNSIAFEHDIEAENAFVEEHGGKLIDSVWGIYNLSDFKSPDPANTENLFHVRLKELRAVDVVDEPAANPSGLFHRGQEVPAEADALCAYALGVSDSRPASASLGIDPDRLRGFASRFLSTRGLTLAQKGEGEMPNPKTKLNAEAVEETQATAETVTEEATQETATEEQSSTETATADTSETESSETKDEKAEALAAVRAEFSRFVALDATDGPKWFNEGKTFEEAQALAIAKLQATNKELSTKLASVNRGEKTPLSFTEGETEETPTKNRVAGLTSGQAIFAQSITIPGRN